MTWIARNLSQTTVWTPIDMLQTHEMLFDALTQAFRVLGRLGERAGREERSGCAAPNVAIEALLSGYRRAERMA